MTKRYTPGPWRLHTRAVAYVKSEEHGVADCSCWDDSTQDTTSEKVANAHLVSAAPDLLEALEHAVIVLQDVAKVSGLTHSDAESCVETARDAIAKAYGEDV